MRPLKITVLSGVVLALGLLSFALVSQRGLAGEITHGNHRFVPRYFPFHDGEKVQYQASWNGIPVATAEVHTSTVWIDGEKYYRVKIHAKTWKLLDLIWKMRDSVDALFNAKTFLPVHYNFSQKENRRRAETKASFDHRAQKWTVRRHKGKEIKEFEFVSPDSFDPVSAGYLLRSLDFKVGDHLELNLFGGHNPYRLTLQVAGREKIDTSTGETDAFKIEAQLVKQARSASQAAVDGPQDQRNKVRRGTVWIAADASRALLKASSEVWVGSVYLELLPSEDHPKT